MKPIEKDAKERRSVITARSLETAIIRIKNKIDNGKFRTLNKANETAVKQLRGLLLAAETIIREKQPL